MRVWFLQGGGWLQASAFIRACLFQVTTGRGVCVRLWHTGLRRLLLQWFRYIILPKAGISIDFSENTTLEGAVAMYAEAFNTWKEKFRAECMVEGKVAGIAEGKAKLIEGCRKLY